MTFATLSLVDPSPAPSVAPVLASCDANALCDFIYRQTGIDWLAESGYYLLVKPFRILLIIVAALVLRYVAHRMIKRVTRGAGDGTGTGLLRPLRERMPASLQDATGLAVRAPPAAGRGARLGAAQRRIGLDLQRRGHAHPRRARRATWLR